MKTVSVVIPVYNGRNYLRAALNSISASRPVEIVVCNNIDSTEDVFDIASEYGAKLIIGGPGVVANWQAALDAATGDYVKLLCHDDILLPGCIDSQAQALDENESVSLVFSSRQIIDSYGDITGAMILQNNGRIVAGEQMIKLLLGYGNLIGESACAMFRRNGVRFPQAMNWLLDMYMWVALLKCGDCLYQPEPMAAIRQHSQQDTLRCLADPEWEAKELADKAELFKLSLI